MTSQTNAQPFLDGAQIELARGAGRLLAEDAVDNPLDIVRLQTCHSRLLSRLAMKSDNPEAALEELLSIHAGSVRSELQRVKEHSQ